MPCAGAVLRVGADGADGGGVCSGAGAPSVPHEFANERGRPSRLRWTVGSFRPGHPGMHAAAPSRIGVSPACADGQFANPGPCEPSGRGIRHAFVRGFGAGAAPRCGSSARPAARHPVAVEGDDRYAQQMLRRATAAEMPRQHRGDGGAVIQVQPTIVGLGFVAGRPRRSPPSRARR